MEKPGDRLILLVGLENDPQLVDLPRCGDVIPLHDSPQLFLCGDVLPLVGFLEMLPACPRMQFHPESVEGAICSVCSKGLLELLCHWERGTHCEVSCPVSRGSTGRTGLASAIPWLWVALQWGGDGGGEGSLFGARLERVTSLRRDAMVGSDVRSCSSHWPSSMA